MKRYFVTTIFLLFITVLFVSCIKKGETIHNQNRLISFIEKIKSASEFKNKKSAKLMLEISDNNKEPIVAVKILLSNPEKEKIVSVRSFLAYNPEVLEGIKINTDNSSFDLSAPEENQFDERNGIVKIGRSTSDKKLDKKELIVANVYFRKIKNEPAIISFYDYKDDATGHTSVNIYERKKVINILEKPEV